MEWQSKYHSQSRSAYSQVDHHSQMIPAGGKSSESVGYFTDYLERMSTDDQQKIKKEIMRGYKPGTAV